MSKLGLITGGAGLIGKQLSAYLREKGNQIIPLDIIAGEGIVQVDLRNEKAVVEIIAEYRPDFIIHLAAMKNLMFCEKNKALSHKTNFGTTEVLVNLCTKLNIHFIYFSSDYVFGNAKKDWREEDHICPTTQYGKDKAASEKLIQECLTNYTIVRTAQLYGFIGDFVSLVTNTLATKQPFNAFANLINCPTWIGDLFPMIDKIIQQQQLGIFHCVGSEALSRYQFAYTIAQVFKLNTSFIQPINLDFAYDIRPSRVGLNGNKTYKRLQVTPNTLKTNLLFYISNIMKP